MKGIIGGISTKFCSTMKTRSTYCELHAGGKILLSIIALYNTCNDLIYCQFFVLLNNKIFLLACICTVL